MSDPSGPAEGPQVPPQDLFSKVRANARAVDGSNVADVPAVVPAENKPARADQPLETPFFCRRCGRYAEFSGYAHPLCGECRTELAARPFPLGVWAFLAVFAVVLCFALVRLPVSAAAGAAFERGWRAERRRDFWEAADEYKAVSRRFPEATYVLVRRAVVNAEAGRTSEALSMLDRLAGRTMSNALIAELNRAEKKIRKNLGAE